MSSVDADISTIRTNVYIDGYNLYHGLRDKYGKKYSWLNLAAFGQSLLSDAKQRLGCVKYFTSEAPGGSQSPTWQRQQTYWKALETLPAVEAIKGRYRQKATRCSACNTEQAECRNCGQKLRFRNEKMTDVNIATHLVKDACAGEFDVAILVGGDTDLLTAVRVVKTMRRIIVAFPPERFNNEMKDAASGSFIISEGKFKANQFPDVVTVASGVTVRRPHNWR